MAKTVIMPRFGMTQEEATIVKWIKREGDRVGNGDPICEVTTDKINMEVEAPADGILAGVRYSEGDTVPVAELIAYIVAEGETPPTGSLPKPTAVATTGSEPASVVTDSQPVQEVKATPLARRMASAKGIDLAGVEGSGKEGQVTRQDVERFVASYPGEIQLADTSKVRAAPAARRLARENRIDIKQLQGSGPQGRVQSWDVQVAVKKLGAEAVPVSAELTMSEPFGGTQAQSIRLEGNRRIIAQRMQASWQQIPHIMFTLAIDMTQAIAMREQFNIRSGHGKPPVSMTAVLVKACAAALRLHPRLNSYFKDDHLLVMPDVNVGVAVALKDGLIVPVVKNADTKGLWQIGQEVSDLSSRAREGSLRPEDLVDGTFTLSNLGMLGVDHFTAIINPPQVAILATGRIAKRYVPDEVDRPIVRSLMTVTLSVDHRVVDGAGATRFLAALKSILETAGAQWG
jgi:pyruvate dehydrogenase E2 component (dihydrolipoamide acetyltransferase)